MVMLRRGCVVLLLMLASACSGGSTPTPTPTPVTVTAGTWGYAIRADVSLFNNGGSGLQSCTAQSSGTTVVSSSGAFSIPFAGLTCSSCSMSGTVTGTIVQPGVSGSLAASTSGSGCSLFQPMPSPAAMSGSCTSASCTVNLNPNIGQNFAFGYTLTPP